MSQMFSRRRLVFVAYAVFFCAVFAFFAVGCGGESDEISPVTAILPDENLAELSEDEQLIFSDVYAGYLVVFFDESLGVRLDPEKGLQSATGKGDDVLSPIRSLIDSRPSLKLARGLELDPKRIDLKRKQAERITGQKLADLNSIYHIETSDPSEAVRIMRELKNAEGVARVYPKTKPVPMEGEGDRSITNLQGYLSDLGVDVVHAGGITGADVKVIDAEGMGNFLHEDLTEVPEGGHVECPPDMSNPDNPYAACFDLPGLRHGTAMAGIVASRSNSYGVTGIAPDSEFLPVFAGESIVPDGSGIFKPGSINIVPLGIFGRLNVGLGWGESSVSQFGGVPIECDPETFTQISHATASGMIVISAAGNGSISLDDPEVYTDRQMQLCSDCPSAAADPGSIFVGASAGESHRKVHFSNSGSRVHLFAWGEGVVTTSYPSSNPESGYNWSGTPPSWMTSSSINSYYTNRFGGTSSATAMIGGVAALVQSYAKRELGESQTRYLTPLKMREVLIDSSVPQETVDMGAPYSVCEAPDGVHSGAGSCGGGQQCLALAPTNPERSCTTYDSQCTKYGGFWTFSPQCINRRCGMSICVPACSGVAGGCASMGWSEFISGGTCYCRPPFGTESMNNGNIGGQPRTDVALTRVDELVAELRADYPELVSGERLTTERLSALWAAGVGLICEPVDLRWYTPPENDPICPEEIVWPTGNGIAKALDFDGDGRADIVRWTNGSWKIDLSGRSNAGDGGDGFASGNNWDVIVEYRPMGLPSDPPGQWLLPYVEDFNSDGRTDFAVYDRLNGKWFIRFTNLDILERGTPAWTGWDAIYDYSSVWHDELNIDPNLSKISRPFPGDYNNDGWVDIAIACSDGFWRFDDNGPRNPESATFEPNFGTFDYSMRYLTDARLSAAPGWAYLPAPSYYSGYLELAFKVPDGLSLDGRLVVTYGTGGGAFEEWPESSSIFGKSDVIVMPGYYILGRGLGIGLKSNDGRWEIVNQNTRTYRWDSITSPAPSDIFGDSSCRPIAADFDGDDLSDRAVMCPDEWRIAYSSADLFLSDRDADTARRIPLTYDTDEFALPGRPYTGGISFEQVERLIETYRRYHPDSPPPIPVDMP